MECLFQKKKYVTVLNIVCPATLDLRGPRSGPKISVVKVVIGIGKRLVWIIWVITDHYVLPSSRSTRCVCVALSMRWSQVRRLSVKALRPDQWSPWRASRLLVLRMDGGCAQRLGRIVIVTDYYYGAVGTRFPRPYSRWDILRPLTKQTEDASVVFPPEMRSDRTTICNSWPGVRLCNDLQNTANKAE